MNKRFRKVFFPVGAFFVVFFMVSSSTALITPEQENSESSFETYEKEYNNEEFVERNTKHIGSGSISTSGTKGTFTSIVSNRVLGFKVGWRITIYPGGSINIGGNQYRHSESEENKMIIEMPLFIGAGMRSTPFYGDSEIKYIFGFGFGITLRYGDY